MTLRQFLRALAEFKGQARRHYTGLIRIGAACPIEAVAHVPNGGYMSGIAKLGLGRYTASAIVAGADSRVSHSKRARSARAQMLTVLGLTTDDLALTES